MTYANGVDKALSRVLKPLVPAGATKAPTPAKRDLSGFTKAVEQLKPKPTRPSPTPNPQPKAPLVDPKMLDAIRRMKQSKAQSRVSWPADVEAEFTRSPGAFASNYPALSRRKGKVGWPTGSTPENPKPHPLSVEDAERAFAMDDANMSQQPLMRTLTLANRPLQAAGAALNVGAGAAESLVPPNYRTPEMQQRVGFAGKSLADPRQAIGEYEKLPMTTQMVSEALVPGQGIVPFKASGAKALSSEALARARQTLQTPKAYARTALETTGPVLGIPKQELRTAGMTFDKTIQGLEKDIAALESALKQPGRIPQGRRADVEKQLARKKAEDVVFRAGRSYDDPQVLGDAIGVSFYEAVTEMNQRVMPFHGRGRNLFPEFKAPALEAYADTLAENLRHLKDTGLYKPSDEVASWLPHAGPSQAEVPQAVAGTPEAGAQAKFGLGGEITTERVTPKGKGEVRQASLTDWGKVEEMKKPPAPSVAPAAKVPTEAAPVPQGPPQPRPAPDVTVPPVEAPKAARTPEEIAAWQKGLEAPAQPEAPPLRENVAAWKPPVGEAERPAVAGALPKGTTPIEATPPGYKRGELAVVKPGMTPIPDDIYRNLTGQPPPKMPKTGAEAAPTPAPKGKRLMEDLTPFETAREVAMRPNTLRWLANLPGVRAVASVLDPASVANSPIKQAIVVRYMSRAEGQTKAIGAFQTLAQLGTERKVFGAVDDSGRLTGKELEGLSLNDIRSNPAKYADRLTDKQKAWIEAADQLERDKLDLLKRNGIDINELTFEEGGRYAGRRVFGKLTPEGELLETSFVSAGPGRPGAKLSVEKHRVFDTAEDAINAGYRYLPEEDALFYNMVGAYNRIADKHMADWTLERIPWRGTTVAEGGQAARFGEAGVQAPAFAGKILTGPDAKETAMLLNKSFTPEFNGALGAVNKANSVFRFFRLAGDAGVFTIQLIFVAGENPKTYGKAMKGFAQALFDQEFHARYLARHADTVQKASNLILAKGGHTEFTEALARGGLLRSGPLHVAGKVLEPFQRGFDAALDVAGIEMREALDHLATTPERAADVDAFVNEFRGLANSARLGVSPLERQLETAAFLAPRYNRAIAALMADVSSGNLRGSLARKSLAKGVAAIVAASVAISYARGEDFDEIADHLNPNSRNFLTWDVGNNQIGPGSKVRSVIKVWANTIRDPENLFSKDITYAKNPILKFVRANLSPVAGDGLDILTGRNYNGDPTRDNWKSFAKTIAAPALAPIWVQTLVMDGGTLTERTQRAAAEFFGLRSYATNPIFEARSEWEADLARYEAIPTNYVERQKKGIATTRQQFKGANPELDAKLFIIGDSDTVLSGEAITTVGQYIKERNIDPMQVKGIKKRMEERQDAQENGIALSPTAVDRIIDNLAVGKPKEGTAAPEAAPTTGYQYQSKRPSEVKLRVR